MPTMIRVTCDDMERERCGRCNGSGRRFVAGYTRYCTGCGGTGRRATKRAAVAEEFLGWLMSKRADQVEAGDVIKAPDGRTAVFISAAAPAVIGMRRVIRLDYFRPGSYAGQIEHDPEARVRLVLDREETAARRRLALEYQEALGKDGRRIGRTRNWIAGLRRELEILPEENPLRALAAHALAYFEVVR